MTPLLSVVIIGRNEGARLRRCLESVKTMDYPGGAFEVIYVDSASTDHSAELAASYGAKVIVVHPQRPTAALGRNAGWRVACAPFVLFLDGDTILHPRFVADSLAEFSDQKVAIVWGHRREIHSAGSLFNRVLDLDWIYRPGMVEFCGGDAIVRRSALEAIDGFDERLIAGEEPEMCRRMRARGLQILHVDRPMTGHDLAMTNWTQYWKRATRAGYAYAEVSARFRNTALPFWEADAQRNRNRAITLIGIALIGPLVSVVMGSPLPLVIAVLALSLLVARSAWKARWKSAEPLTAILYGIHSHLQQIPIFLGQLQYQRDAKSGRKRGLIEYKEASS
jgi:cellulose synthase/poly-beta-1,6-N-acetylglucosamine synthase-like glycosyltransferase